MTDRLYTTKCLCLLRTILFFSLSLSLSNVTWFYFALLKHLSTLTKHWHMSLGMLKTRASLFTPSLPLLIPHLTSYIQCNVSTVTRQTLPLFIIDQLKERKQFQFIVFTLPVPAAAAAPPLLWPFVRLELYIQAKTLILGSFKIIFTRNLKHSLDLRRLVLSSSSLSSCSAILSSCMCQSLNTWRFTQNLCHMIWWAVLATCLQDTTVFYVWWDW